MWNEVLTMDKRSSSSATRSLIKSGISSENNNTRHVVYRHAKGLRRLDNKTLNNILLENDISNHHSDQFIYNMR